MTITAAIRTAAPIPKMSRGRRNTTRASLPIIIATHHQAAELVRLLIALHTGREIHARPHTAGATQSTSTQQRCVGKKIRPMIGQAAALTTAPVTRLSPPLSPCAAKRVTMLA
jgi:hypothetical protein